jgi:hypothetical protein
MYANRLTKSEDASDIKRFEGEFGFLAQQKFQYVADIIWTEFLSRPKKCFPYFCRW